MKQKIIVGRPKAIEGKKKTAKVFINLTEEQKKILQKKADEEERSLSQICIFALKQCNILPK